MSSDNGVYILKTGFDQYNQFRVLRTQAIENLWWSIIDRCEKPEIVPTRIMEYFGDCRYTRNENIALKLASDMERKYPTEYGVRVIYINESYNKIKNKAKELAQKEIEFINNNLNKDGSWNFELKRLQKILKMG
jgi:hypothetical protein